MLDGDIREACRNACAERIRIEHVSQPVAALRQHLGEKAFYLPPAIVDAFEPQLDISPEAPIRFAVNQHATRGAPVELARPLRDDERPARLSRDRQLAREPEVERVDRLDAQSAWVFLEPPAPLRIARTNGSRQRIEMRGLRILR